MKKKKDLSKEISDKRLDPLAKYCENKRGAIAELTRRVNAMNGRPVARQHLEQWLKPKRSDRVQPRFGMGLILVEVGNALMQENP
jgi:hypothetical protein